jgi:hypothetical protein
VEDAGDSTDASLPPSDAWDFEEAIQKLRAKVKALFDDVKAKEFRDPKHGIAVWFGEWRTKYEDSWKNAWGGMGLVQAWEFWARVEMVGWIPLDARTTYLTRVVAVTDFSPTDTAASGRICMVFRSARLLETDRGGRACS